MIHTNTEWRTTSPVTVRRTSFFSTPWWPPLFGVTNRLFTRSGRNVATPPRVAAVGLAISFLIDFFTRFIMKMTGGETDTTKEVVYTDWAAVRRFASDFVALPLTVPTRPKPEIPKRSSWITSSGIACFLVIAVASALSASPIGCKVMAAVRG